MNYRTNEKNTEISEKLEKLESKLEDLEIRLRYNKSEDKSKISGAQNSSFSKTGKFQNVIILCRPMDPV